MNPIEPSDPPEQAVHPGKHFRSAVLKPRGLSVLAAAKLLGVGRPALSNFVNGRASASSEMASRIEHVFGLNAQVILDMQAAYDSAHARSKGRPPNSRPYVAPFLDLLAKDIEEWVDRNIGSRVRLPVFLRTLVHSTGIGLDRVDFPGNDDAQRSGWDGQIECSQSTTWIPAGKSGWEFGVNKDAKTKADGDYAKAVSATERAERIETTFVFVTPRHWPGKDKWVTAKNAEANWREVRAYDSSDLEQWLQQSIAGQVWFANETQRPSEGVRSLDRCWTDWAHVAEPPLSGKLFLPAIESARRTLVSRLTAPQSEPITIAADSVDEALAFLSRVFSSEGGPDLEPLRDRVLIFDKPGTLPKLAHGTKNFVAVAPNRDVERELGALAHAIPTIVVYPRNAVSTTPHIVLEPLNHESFRLGLEDMGYGRDQTTRYAQESGRSLTVLRRRLSKVPAIRSPLWVEDQDTASTLIPFLLVGAWSSTNSADRAALELITVGKNYDELERAFQRLARLDDAPVWSVGTHRGVISKIDLLFAVASATTVADLNRYFELASIVLGEDDPRLDVPEHERVLAMLRGKSREFSGLFRKGIAETLVLLSVHGDQLFRSRLGIEFASRVSRVVRELLTPLTTRRLEANDRELPVYAEAAPDEFLSILEADLLCSHPETFGLLRSVESGVFGSSCPRTGLLWALEGLAWNPETMPRVALVLGRLATIEITDNWANKPISSLESIFRVWMPQTACDADERLQVIHALADRFPDVAWKICIAQLNSYNRIGHYSHKPTWRNDGYGVGEPIVSTASIMSFLRALADMILSWRRQYSTAMLCDLVERLNDLDESHRSRIWGIINAWIPSASDADKAELREKIRVTTLSKRARKRVKKTENGTSTDAAATTYETLTPADLVSANEWLFREHWVQETAGELHDEDDSYEAREARIAELRVSAIREIEQARGLAGLFDLATRGKASGIIGWLLAREVLPSERIPELLAAALTHDSTGNAASRAEIIRGALRSIEDESACTRAIEVAMKSLSDGEVVRLLQLSPFRRSTWQLVDQLAPDSRDAYWADAVPEWKRAADADCVEAVERLLLAHRPRAAFASLHLDLEAIDPELLYRVLTDMATDGQDEQGQYQMDAYSLETAFRVLDKCAALTLDQKATLEFAYIDVLYQPWQRGNAYGIPNLEKYVEVHPELFIQAIVWTYRRSDGEDDPAEWRVADEDRSQLATRGHKLLDAVSRMPGHDSFGELQTELLANWVKTVRDACEGLGRRDVADNCLGKLLSCASAGADGVWPCESVRQVMEDFHSKSMADGARIGVYNSRGVTWRGEGGDQERELAAKYRKWAGALRYTHPFVASEFLSGIAKTYEDEANREDLDVDIRRRLTS